MAERYFVDGKPVMGCRPRPQKEGEELVVRGDCDDQLNVVAVYEKKYTATTVGAQLVWATTFR